MGDTENTGATTFAVVAGGAALWLAAIAWRIGEMRDRGERFDDEDVDKFFRLNGLGDLADSLKSGTCPARLPPLVRWPGGKGRMASKLLGMFPKHDTYVEPFAGGASVFFHKPLAAKNNVIADMDPWVIDLYRDVQKGKLESCEDGIIASRSLFGRAQKNKSACHKVALSAMSYHGNRKSFFLPASGKEGKAIYRAKLKLQGCYAKKLKRAKVIKGDFAKVMSQYDSPTALHYLDPPWPLDYSDMYHADGGPKRGKSKDKHAFGGAMDPAHVRKVCDKMKGTVVVHYNWTPALAKTFSGPGWTVKKIQVATHIAQKGNVNRPNMIAIKKARR